MQGGSSIATVKVLEESPDPICLFTLIYTMFTYNYIHLYYLKLQFNMDIYVLCEMYDGSNKTFLLLHVQPTLLLN